jgi:hypothetical protein
MQASQRHRIFEAGSAINNSKCDISIISQEKFILQAKHACRNNNELNKIA